MSLPLGCGVPPVSTKKKNIPDISGVLGGISCGICDYCQRVHTQWARFEYEVDDVVPITVRDRGSVRKAEGDLDLTYLWEKFTANTSAGVSKGAEMCSGASAHNHTEVPTEQSASQGSAPNAGSMQSSAVAHDCEGSREAVSSLVCVIQRCYWYGMVRDVQVYIATCAECTRNKRVRVNPRAPLQCFQDGNPGEWLHLDILGPFLESSRGNRYVLMMVDQFTHWLEFQALGIQDAKTVARVFFESYTVRFDVPFVIHTDQGLNFDGNFFQAFCNVLDCVKTRTTPYRPSSNGQVERYNQQVLNFLRCFL